MTTTATMTNEVAGMKTAAMRIVKVPFHSDEIEAVQEADGRLWVSLRKLCDNMGIQVSPQLRKIRSEPWACVSEMITHDSSGRQQLMTMIDFETVPMWLSSITTGKVKPSVRDKLRLYKNECARVLANHFLRLRTPASAPTPTPLPPPPPAPPSPPTVKLYTPPAEPRPIPAGITAESIRTIANKLHPLRNLGSLTITELATQLPDFEARIQAVLNSLAQIWVDLAHHEYKQDLDRRAREAAEMQEIWEQECREKDRQRAERAEAVAADVAKMMQQAWGGMTPKQFGEMAEMMRSKVAGALGVKVVDALPVGQSASTANGSGNGSGGVA